jgi:2-alkenal reductase
MNPKTGDLGDVIIGVNGKRVEALSDFVGELARSGVDSVVELTVLRDDRERRVRVKVIEVGR